MTSRRDGHPPIDGFAPRKDEQTGPQKNLEIRGRGMREVFEDKDHDRAQPHLEPDLTLGPVTLLGLLFIWALICALFFGWGYAVGHRGSEDTSAVMKPAPASSQAGYAQSKPSAVSQTEIATAAESDGAD